MNVSSKHWGSIPDWERSEDDWGDDWSLSPTDMEDLLTPQPPPPHPLELYQPSQEETPSFQILPAEFCRTDPLVLQTIRLLQYQRQVAQLITRAQGIGAESANLSTCPAPPEDPVIESRINKPLFLNFIPPDYTPFTSGKNQPQKLEVEGTTARLILRKAVATICAHTGYTDTTESVLRVLTDVTHEFMMKLTSVLRSNTDSLLETDHCPFHDVVEQSLHDMSMGSISDLHKMYLDRVINYHARVRQDAFALYQQYLLLTPSTLPHSSRRDSISEWWMEEPGSQPGVSNFGVMLGMEEASVPSIKSTSSLDPEMSLHPFSILSQAGVDGDDAVQNSPATTQQYQPYPLTPR